LISDYEDLIEEILGGLSPANYAAAVDLAALPLEIRGFGHVKEANIPGVRAKEAALRARFRSAALQAIAAE
jgi:indolepyruvate ferredoxin oxidoreductase